MSIKQKYKMGQFADTVTICATARQVNCSSIPTQLPVRKSFDETQKIIPSADYNKGFQRLLTFSSCESKNNHQKTVSIKPFTLQYKETYFTLKNKLQEYIVNPEEGPTITTKDRAANYHSYNQEGV